MTPATSRRRPPAGLKRAPYRKTGRPVGAKDRSNSLRGKVTEKEHTAGGTCAHCGGLVTLSPRIPRPNCERCYGRRCARCGALLYKDQTIQQNPAGQYEHVRCPPTKPSAKD